MKYRPRKYVPAPEGSVWSDEAARRLGIALSTLYKWRQNSYGPAPYPVGRKLAYELAVIEAWLGNQRSTAVQPSVATAA